MFNNDLRCLVSRATIGIAARRSRQRRWDPRYRRKSDPMINSILNGDWSNSVPGKQFPKGRSDSILQAQASISS